MANNNQCAFDDSLRQRIGANLALTERRQQPLRGRRAAAVAATLIGDSSGRACFVITKRAMHLRRHAGQWALPGGAVDAGESVRQAALRELHEEIDLALADDAILGLLDDFPSRSGYVITPVVVWAGIDPVLTPDPNEVAAIHRVPLTALEAPGVPRIRSIEGSDQPLLSLPLDDTLGSEVFAPTAAILYQLRELALHGRATRVDHFEQPRFAWR